MITQPATQKFIKRWEQFSGNALQVSTDTQVYSRPYMVFVKEIGWAGRRTFLCVRS